MGHARSCWHGATTCASITSRSPNESRSPDGPFPEPFFEPETRRAAASRSESSTRCRARRISLEPLGVPGSTSTSAPPGATRDHSCATVSSARRLFSLATRGGRVRAAVAARSSAPRSDTPPAPPRASSSPRAYAATTRSKVALECSARRDATVRTAPDSPHGCGSGSGLPLGRDRKPIPSPSSRRSASSAADFATRRAKVIMLGEASTSVALPADAPPPTPKAPPKTSRAAHSAGAGPAPNSRSVFGSSEGQRSRSSRNTRLCAPKVMGRRATAYAAASKGPYVAAPTSSFLSANGAPFSFALPLRSLDLSRVAAFSARPSMTLACFFGDSRTPHSTSRMRFADCGPSVPSIPPNPSGSSASGSRCFLSQDFTDASSPPSPSPPSREMTPRDTALSASSRLRPFAFTCRCVAPVSRTATRTAFCSVSGSSTMPSERVESRWTPSRNASPSRAVSKETRSSRERKAAGSTGGASWSSPSKNACTLRSSTTAVSASSRDADDAHRAPAAVQLLAARYPQASCLFTSHRPVAVTSARRIDARHSSASAARPTTEVHGACGWELVGTIENSIGLKTSSAAS